MGIHNLWCPFGGLSRRGQELGNESESHFHRTISEIKIYKVLCSHLTPWHSRSWEKHLNARVKIEQPLAISRGAVLMF